MARKISTKEKILKTASSVFSLNGYKETTIRMISEKADVNVASINYHFGDKENLYTEVIRYWAKDAFRDFPVDQLEDQTLSAQKRIELFIHNTLICLLGKDGKGTGFGRLMALEASISPSGVVHEVVKETIGRPTEYLKEALKEITGIEDEEKLNVYTACIVGETVYFFLSKNLLADLFEIGDLKNEKQIHALAAHIYDFTIGALKNAG